MATRNKDTWSRWNQQWWDRNSTIGGIVAGISFVVFELAAAIFPPVDDDIVQALRVRGAILYGPEVIEPSAPMGPPVVTGLVIHLGLASIFGLFFGIIMAHWARLARSLGRIIMVAVTYGIGLWLLNIYVIAPVYGWTWFPHETDPVVQALGHSLFFGVPLALFLYRMLAPRRRLGLI